MAVSFVQSTSNTATANWTTTGCTPTFASPATNGNLVIVAVGARGNRTFTASDEFSWTPVPNGSGNNGTNCDIALFYRIAGAGEAASQGNFQLDTASIHGFVIAMEFSGVDTSSPFADSNNVTDTATSHDLTTGSVDASVTYALAWFWAAATGTDYSSVSAGTLQETPNTGGGSNVAGAGAYQTGVTGSTTYSRTTTAGASAAGAGAWVVINPSGPVSKSGSDSGTLTDTAAIAADTTGTAEAGAFSEFGAIALPGTEAGTADDQAGVAAVLDATDTGAFSEFVVVIDVATTDTGAFAEAVSIDAALTSTDSGTFTDTGTVEEQSEGVTPVTASDTGTLTDDGSQIAASAATSESGTLTEYGAIALPGSDSGTTADDQAGIAVAAAAAEIAALSDAALIAAVLSATDSGTFSETSSIIISIPGTDAPYIQTPTRAVPVLNGRTRLRLTNDGATLIDLTADGKTRVEV